MRRGKKKNLVFKKKKSKNLCHRCSQGLSLLSHRAHLRIKLSFSDGAPGPRLSSGLSIKSRAQHGSSCFTQMSCTPLPQSFLVPFWQMLSLNGTQVLCHLSLWLRPNQELIPAGCATRARGSEINPFLDLPSSLNHSVGETSPESALPPVGETQTLPFCPETFQSPRNGTQAWIMKIYPFPYNKNMYKWVTCCITEIYTL